VIRLADYLQLTRSLAVLDLETTGLNPEQDRIVQIGITMHYVHKDPVSWQSFVNPGRNIENSHFHGVSDSMVREAPTFLMIAPALAPRLLAVDIMGYNVEFDIGMLRAEMKRANVDWPWNGHIIDPYQIYRRRRPHSLSAAYEEYGGEEGNSLPEGTKLEGAHDAGIDVAAAEVVLRGQLLRYPDLPKTPEALEDYCFPRKANALDKSGRLLIWHNGVACIAFGKHARNGPKPLKDLDRSYMEWIIANDFPEDVKGILQGVLMGVFPEPKG
jgi:DNA polymerase-3 subunit epsilon